MQETHMRCGFNPWVRKIPWRKAWQPAPVCLPGKAHGQKMLASCSRWGHKQSEQDWSDLVCRTLIHLGPLLSPLCSGISIRPGAFSFQPINTQYSPGPCYPPPTFCLPLSSLPQPLVGTHHPCSLTFHPLLYPQHLACVSIASPMVLAKSFLTSQWQPHPRWHLWVLPPLSWWVFTWTWLLPSSLFFSSAPFPGCYL